jgi:hypothetical protein
MDRMQKLEVAAELGPRRVGGARQDRRVKIEPVLRQHRQQRPLHVRVAEV